MTDIPFKLSARTIAILKDLPVLQCGQCAEYVIEDSTMEKVEARLEKVDPNLELEIVGFSTIECSEDQLYEKVEKALRTFFRKDGKLLHIDANERSITHKVAEYLQYQFPDMNVDCEYNRRGGSGSVKKSSSTGQGILPDIIVHERGTNKNNCLVIEIKKEGGNSEGAKKDRIKLAEYTSSLYEYKVGLFLVFDVGKKRISKVSIYKNGKEEKTDEKWKRLTDLVNPVLSSGQLSEEPS